MSHVVNAAKRARNSLQIGGTHRVRFENRQSQMSPGVMAAGTLATPIESALINADYVVVILVREANGVLDSVELER